AAPGPACAGGAGRPHPAVGHGVPDPDGQQPALRDDPRAGRQSLVHRVPRREDRPDHARGGDHRVLRGPLARRPAPRDHGAARPDGNLWFTEPRPSRIGRITPAGVITEFSAGLTPGFQPRGITAGPDGNLWFTEQFGLSGRVGRITPAGVITEFSAGITPGT